MKKVKGRMLIGLGAWLLIFLLIGCESGEEEVAEHITGDEEIETEDEGERESEERKEEEEVETEEIKEDTPSEESKEVEREDVTRSKETIAGNLVNGGKMAVYDDWVYFSERIGPYSTILEITRMRKDGSITERVFGEEVPDYSKAGGPQINVEDGWIYFKGGSGRPQDFGIYRVRIDGTGHQRLNEANAMESKVVGDWIYYSDNFDDRSLYKMRTDGSETQKLTDDYTYMINVSEDWVYYTNGIWDRDKERYDKPMYRVRTDGSDRQLITEESSERMIVAEDWIYYLSTPDEYDNNNIYRMRTDGSELQQLTDHEHQTGTMNISEGWIYYNVSGLDESMEEEVTGIYKMRLDGSDRERITDQPSTSTGMSIAGDWVYFMKPRFMQRAKIYRIHTDGSGLAPLEDLLNEGYRE